MIVYGHDELVAQWVAAKLHMPPFPRGMCRAIGVTENNQLIAGVVYHNQHLDNRGKPLLIEMSIASLDKRWCTRHNLHELFQYPFRQLGVKRVQATCGRKAKRVRLFLSRLGFKFEGIQREANPFGGDLAHYSMLLNECKWLIYGQKFPLTSRSARPNSGIGSADQIQ